MLSTYRTSTVCSDEIYKELQTIMGYSYEMEKQQLAQLGKCQKLIFFQNHSTLLYIALKLFSLI